MNEHTIPVMAERPIMSNPLAKASFEARSARLRMARAELLPPAA